MTEKDFDDFAALMLGIAENYGQGLTAQGIALRFRMLEKHAFKDVQRAAFSLMAVRKYNSIPTVADFLEHLGGGSDEDRALVEAGKVLEAVKRHGGWKSVAFDDPVTQAVIRQAFGGWVKLCEDCGREESEKWFRHEFAKTWAAYKRQGVTHYGVLPGRMAIRNGADGFTVDEIPALAGNPKAAAKMLQEGKRKDAREEENIRQNLLPRGRQGPKAPPLADKVNNQDAPKE